MPRSMFPPLSPEQVAQLEALKQADKVIASLRDEYPVLRALQDQLATVDETYTKYMALIASRPQEIPDYSTVLEYIKTLSRIWETLTIDKKLVSQEREWKKQPNRVYQLVMTELQYLQDKVDAQDEELKKLRLRLQSLQSKGKGSSSLDSQRLQDGEGEKP